MMNLDASDGVRFDKRICGPLYLFAHDSQPAIGNQPTVNSHEPLIV
jgi:hypothetical protein